MAVSKPRRIPKDQLALLERERIVRLQGRLLPSGEIVSIRVPNCWNQSWGPSGLCRSRPCSNDLVLGVALLKE